MKRLLTTISIAGLLAPLAACAGQPWQVQPVLGSSPTPAVASELAPDEEGDIAEASSDCFHELGSDSSDSARASVEFGRWVTGCFVDGDAVDAFVIHAPASGVYKIELLHRGGSALSASVVDASGQTLSRLAAIEEGQLATEAVSMQAGQSYVLKIENQRPSSAWYELKAAPQATIVSQR